MLQSSGCSLALRVKKQHALQLQVKLASSPYRKIKAGWYQAILLCLRCFNTNLHNLHCHNDRAPLLCSEI